jgi:3-hexulose-6-phosphate synthase
MKLQLSLDFISIPDAEALLEEIHQDVDIIEAGTPLIIKEGIVAVRILKEAYPDKLVLADLKIADAGYHEAEIAFEAGADIVTVLSFADDSTIRGAIEAAKKYGKEVMVDMIGSVNIAERSAEIENFGVDYICVHTAVDVQASGKNPLEDLQSLKKTVKRIYTAVAGGIKLETVADIAREKPDVIIVGGGITSSIDKKKTTEAIRAIMNSQE